MEEVYVPHNPHEKAMQRALIQYRNPKNYDLVKEALIKAGRTDLIGFDKKCLIRPREMHWCAGASFSGGTRQPGNRNTDRKSSGFGSGAAKTGTSNAAKKATAGSVRSAGKKAFGTGSESRKPGKKKTIRNVHKKK